MQTQPPDSGDRPTVPQPPGKLLPEVAADLAVSAESAVDSLSQSTKIHYPTPDTSEATPAPAQRPLKRFDRYEIRGKLGEGGMGEVYRAFDPELNREVALKTLTTEASRGSSSAERFTREARAAAGLRHPNIVRIYDVGEAEDRFYFTMELVEGGSLHDHLRDYRLPSPPSSTRTGAKSGQAKSGEVKSSSATSQLSRAESRERQSRIVTLMEKVARAVAHAHEHGIVHRDLKPGNILLEKGEPLVSDFGLAKVSEAKAELTHEGTLLGTPAYMSPEQCMALVNVGPASDVWSLGVILYELLTGQKPFPGKNRDEISPKVLGEPVTPPRVLNKHIDPGLEAIVLRCLEKDLKGEGRRYRTALEVADELKRVREGRGPAVRPEVWRVRVLKGIRRHAALLVLLALAAGALTYAAVVAFKSYDRDRSKREEPEKRDNDAAAEAIQKQLRAGQAVDLQDAAGLPRFREFKDIGGRSTVTAAGGVLRVEQQTGLSVVKILEDPFCKTYEFSGEVRQDECESGGEVGLCPLAWDRSTPRGYEVALLSLVFADKGRPIKPLADGSAAGRLDLQLSRRVGQRTFFASLLDSRDQRAVTTPDGYRRLRMRVNPVQIEFEIDDGWKQVLERTEIISRARRGLFYEVNPQIVKPGTQFAAELAEFNEGVRGFNFGDREVLSLYVDQSTASFRNLKITPSAP